MQIPPQAMSRRPGVEDAYAQAQAELAGPPEAQEAQDIPEIHSRIMRIEDLLVKRGLATEADFAAPEGAPPGAPPDAAAAGAPPVPQGAPPA